MKREFKIAHRFVEFIPDSLEERTLYISRAHATAVHKCFCGCGREVVTPLSPVGWELTVEEDSVSLYPSIGSWSLPCRSHYFITHNRVAWAHQWSQRQIERGRAAEAAAKKTYFAQVSIKNKDAKHNSDESVNKPSIWRRILYWIFRRFAP